jgi:monoamine oxidase
MDTVQAQLHRLRQADQGSPRRHVLILGAGMAGLAAAHELESLGHSATILDSAARVGGRVRTHYFADGTYGELGAMRIPISHDFTRHYVNLLGLQLRQFINTHDHLEGFYDIRGVVARIKDAPAAVYPRFDLSREQQADRVAPLIFARAISDTVEGLSEPERLDLVGNQPTGERLRELDRLSLGEYLRLRCGTSAAELAGLATGLESLFDRAVTNFVRDAIVEEGSRLDEIIGGMETLPMTLASRLRAPIHLRTRVRSLAVRADRTIEIGAQRDDGAKQYTADTVLCTLPFTVLRRLDLGGAFSAEKMHAIRNLGYASSTKVLLHCTERFWESRYGIFGGASHSDQLIRATYYPSDNAQIAAAFAGAALPPTPRYMTAFTGHGARTEGSAGFAAQAAGVLLGSYTWGRDARSLGTLDHAERVRVVTELVARFHPEIKSQGMVDGAASIFWDQDPGMCGGAFSLLEPGDHVARYRAAIAPERRIYFAGEHCSLFNGWIQGALVSALRAVEEILQSPPP